MTRLTNKIFLHTKTKCVRDLKYFAHRIHSSASILRSSEKRPVHYTQSASCSYSSVESSAKVTVRSESVSDGMSVGVGSRQTTLFRLFEGPRWAFDWSRLDWDLVACLICFSWVQPKNFCKMNSLFSLLSYHEDLTVDSGMAQSWYLKHGGPQQKWKAKNWKNWMMAACWSSPKQDGSQKQVLCPLRQEGYRVVWTSSFHKETGLSPESL